MKNIPRVKEAGVYGIVAEGMKFAKAKPGMVRIGGDSCYPKDVLERDFLRIKQEAHRNSLRFFSGENRLRAMGDDMCCCGIENLPGFKGNDYNLCMIVNREEPGADRTDENRWYGRVLQEPAAERRNVRQDRKAVLLRTDAGGTQLQA